MCHKTRTADWYSTVRVIVRADFQIEVVGFCLTDCHCLAIGDEQHRKHRRQSYMSSRTCTTAVALGSQEDWSDINWMLAYILQLEDGGELPLHHYIPGFC